MTFNDRRVVIILEIDVIKRAEEVAGKIGDPTPYSEGNPLSLCPDSKLVIIKKNDKLRHFEGYSVKSFLQVKPKHHMQHQSLTPALPYNPRTEVKVSDCGSFNSNSSLFLLQKHCAQMASRWRHFSTFFSS